MSNKKDLGKGIVLVPCFNESGSILHVLREISESTNLQILVIDDKSTDDSVSLCEGRCTVLRLPTNIGIGGAMQTGFKWAQREDFDYAIQVDGDGQHDPSQISSFLERLQSREVDLIVGSRFLEDGGFRSTFSRRIGISIISSVLRLLFGIQMTDPTSGFRLYGRRAIHFFSGEYPSDYPEPISVAMAQQRGLKLLEVPVRMRERTHGVSSISQWDGIYYMLKVIIRLVLLKI